MCDFQNFTPPKNVMPVEQTPPIVAPLKGRDSRVISKYFKSTLTNNFYYIGTYELYSLRIGSDFR